MIFSNVMIHLVQVPFCEDESVQLFRVAFFRRDFFQNPYFSSIKNQTSQNPKLRSCRISVSSLIVWKDRNQYWFGHDCSKWIKEDSYTQQYYLLITQYKSCCEFKKYLPCDDNAGWQMTKPASAGEFQAQMGTCVNPSWLTSLLFRLMSQKMNRDNQQDAFGHNWVNQQNCIPHLTYQSL